MPLPAHLGLRPVSASDNEFIYRVILATMRDYIVATWGRCDEARIREEAAEADEQKSSIVLVHQQPAGVITVVQHSAYVELEQLYLLPQYQDKGIGKLLMQNLLADAGVTSRPIRLRALAVNPARRFYEQLGFVKTAETTEHVCMEYVRDNLAASDQP